MNTAVRRRRTDERRGYVDSGVGFDASGGKQTFAESDQQGDIFTLDVSSSLNNTGAEDLRCDEHCGQTVLGSV